MTHDELRKLVIGALSKAGCDNPHWEMPALADVAIRVALGAAKEAIIEQRRIFGTEEYATSQPLSSIRERFACNACLREINSLMPKEASDDA